MSGAGALEPITVKWPDGRFPGVRCGRVAAYEFEVPIDRVRPGAPARQRSFLLLDESIQIAQPVVFPEAQAGWWYCDLLRIVERGRTVEVADRFIDVIVGPPGHAYRVLDLHEYGDAIESGQLGVREAIDGLRAFQAFLDRHLNRRHDVTLTWPDFPPASLAVVMDAPIQEPEPA